jgi:hypothetical protein
MISFVQALWLAVNEKMKAGFIFSDLPAGQYSSWDSTGLDVHGMNWSEDARK